MRLPIVVLAGATVLGAATAPALDANTRAGTSSELTAMTATVHASPVAGMSSVPQNNSRLVKPVVYPSGRP